MSKKLLFTALLVLLIGLLAACSPQSTPEAPLNTEEMPMNAEDMPMATEEMPMTSGGMAGMAEAPNVPAGLAFAEGEEIRFIHTEVSDPDVAVLLSDMMSSPVIHVPSLADAPDSMLAKVYVFKNGAAGMGPLGFQPDVFDNPPDSEGYSPLRRITFVTWTDESKARELKSLAEVMAAQEKGEIVLEESNVVVNMPFITWPGGQR